MQIVFDTPEEKDVFKTELFKTQTFLAKNNPPEGIILFIEKLFYLSNSMTDKK